MKMEQIPTEKFPTEKFSNDQGFSLIELVIAIAILAIMCVGGMSAMGYLSMANSSKCASRIDSSLTVLKSKNSAEARSTYMHLYRYRDRYYVRYSNQPSYTPDDSNYKEGEEIGNSQITISYQEGNLSASSVTIQDGDCKTFGIRKKDGAFTGTMEPTCVISVIGQSTYKVTLVTNTGKHFRD